jgi:hypothetical protein
MQQQQGSKGRPRPLRHALFRKRKWETERQTRAAEEAAAKRQKIATDRAEEILRCYELGFDIVCSNVEHDRLFVNGASNELLLMKNNSSNRHELWYLPDEREQLIKLLYQCIASLPTALLDIVAEFVGVVYGATVRDTSFDHALSSVSYQIEQFVRVEFHNQDMFAVVLLTTGKQETVGTWRLDRKTGTVRCSKVYPLAIVDVLCENLADSFMLQRGNHSRVWQVEPGVMKQWDLEHPERLLEADSIDLIWNSGYQYTIDNDGELVSFDKFTGLLQWKDQACWVPPPRLQQQDSKFLSVDSENRAWLFHGGDVHAIVNENNAITYTTKMRLGHRLRHLSIVVGDRGSCLICHGAGTVLVKYI